MLAATFCLNLLLLDRGDSHSQWSAMATPFQQFQVPLGGLNAALQHHMLVVLDLPPKQVWLRPDLSLIIHPKWSGDIVSLLFSSLIGIYIQCPRPGTGRS